MLSDCRSCVIITCAVSLFCHPYVVPKIDREFRDFFHDTPAPDPAELVMQFAARYPRDHDYAGGELIERGRQCHCGRWFAQQLIDRSWLEMMQAYKPDLLKRFLDACEVEISEGRRLVYCAGSCPNCERHAINAA